MSRVRNTQPQIQVFNLPHATCCARECLCKKESVVVFVQFKGTMAPREEKRLVPRSVTFLAGQEKDVADVFFLAPEVKEALRRGGLVRVGEQGGAKLVPATASPTTESEARPTTTRSNPGRSRGHRAGKEE